jgi:hypothetical protein
MMISVPGKALARKAVATKALATEAVATKTLATRKSRAEQVGVTINSQPLGRIVAGYKRKVLFISSMQWVAYAHVHCAFRGEFQTEVHIVPATCWTRKVDRLASVAGDGVRDSFGPGTGNSSGILPGSSFGGGSWPGSCTGGGTSGRGLPGGSSGGGSVGWPGVAGGIPGGSVGITIAT